ncbi:MAG: hypothetical protein K1X51_06570 [Rhodospirillaceae bacterium]|nr:hypothetical protein [Rhodospirillaceae bacterium]
MLSRIEQNGTACQGHVRAMMAQGRFADAEKLAGTAPASRTIIADEEPRQDELAAASLPNPELN